MIKRDLLCEVFKGLLSEEAAGDIVNLVLDSSSAAQVESLLEFSRVEWTGYGHGASLAELADWRYQGWPKKCSRCHQDVRLEGFGWKVVDLGGKSALQHIVCP